MIQKKIMKVIRGKATPLQVFLACVIGAVIGLLPGPTPAPGLFLVSLAMLFVLNANLFIATAVFLGAKLVAVLGEPPIFEVGLFLIEGPVRPLFAWLVNTPVLALMGFDNYSSVGGLVVGLVGGSGLGVGVAWALIKSRKALALLEKQTQQDGSAARKILRNPLVKIVTFVCLGGLEAKGKNTYADLVGEKYGLPVRPLGIVTLVLLLVLVGAIGYAGREGFFTGIAKVRLEQANGATVDLERVDIDLAGGSVLVAGLAMADPSDLARNTIEADEVRLDIATSDLLTKRIAFDLIELSGAKHASARATPGRLIERVAEPASIGGGAGAPAPGEGGLEVELDGSTTQRPGEPDESYEQRAARLDRVLANANDVIGKVRQVYRVVDRFNGTAGVSEDTSGQTVFDSETIKDAKRREARLRGFHRVTADHLLQGSPRLVIREIVAEGITSTQAPGETFDARATNVSTDPVILGQAASFALTSASGNIDADLSGLGGGGVPDVNVRVRDLSTADLFGILSESVRSELSVAGGRADLSIVGRMPPGTLDATIEVTLRDVRATVPGLGGGDARDVTLDRLPVAITVLGPIGAPTIDVDDEAFTSAVARAIGDQATDRALQEVDKLIGDKLPDGVAEQLDGVLDDDRKDKAKKAIRGLFGGGDDDEDDG